MNGLERIEDVQFEDESETEDFGLLAKQARIVAKRLGIAEDYRQFYAGGIPELNVYYFSPTEDVEHVSGTWLVFGDLPPLAFNTSMTSAKDVLIAYCDHFDNPSVELIVNADGRQVPFTPDLRRSLESRVRFIREKILPIWDSELAASSLN